MATKKISDLTLRSNFDDTCQLPADDSSQTWRVTGAQMKTWSSIPDHRTHAGFRRRAEPRSGLLSFQETHSRSR